MSRTPSYTNVHPNLVGNGLLAAPFSKRLDIAATVDADALNCLNISYAAEVGVGLTPAVTPKAATYTVTATTNVITLLVQNHSEDGSDNADVSFTITPASAKVAWSSGAASAYTLKDVIDLINKDDAGGTSGELLAGFKCWIGPGGMYDMLVDLTAAGFQAETETAIMPAGSVGGYTGFFKRDMNVWVASDSDYLTIWRLGQPEARDRGLFKLLDLYGVVTADTGDQISDHAGIMVVRDDVEDFVEPVATWATDIANHEVVYHVDRDNFPTNSGTAAYSMEHNPVDAPVARGPLVVIIKHDTDYDTNAVHVVARMQAAS